MKRATIKLTTVERVFIELAECGLAYVRAEDATTAFFNELTKIVKSHGDYFDYEIEYIEDFNELELQLIYVHVEDRK